MSGRPGEVWFAEGDTPSGPWVYARRVVSHDHYNFYNPTQHPFFDQDGGRLIYFEGTYTAAFSAAKQKTPRYDYNQIMYRLALDDARLNLPVPVYRVKGAGGATCYLTREGIEREQLWNQIEDVAFFALAPGRGRGGMIPIFEQKEAGQVVLRDTPSPGRTQPIFFALPPRGRPAESASDPTEDQSSAVVPLFEHRHVQSGRRTYSTNPEPADQTLQRPVEPVCRVWRNPMSALILDPDAKPVPLARE